MDLENITIFKATSALFALYSSVKLFNYFYDLWYYSRIPGLRTIPFIGNTYRFLKNKKGYTQEAKKMVKEFENEKCYRLWLGTHPVIFIHRADLLEDFCNEMKLNNKSFEYSLLYPWLKTGLVTSGGEKWAFRRKLITPSFHFDILKDYLLIMNEHAVIFTENLKNLKCKEKIPMEFHIKAFSLDVICEAAMGHHVNAQTEHSSEYLQAVYSMSSILAKRILSPWLWIDFIFQRTKTGKRQARCLKILHQFTRNIINERAENFKGICRTNNKRIPFLDMLLDARLKNPDSITLDDIQEEVDTFMFEGHDTVSTALNWLFFNLATNPHVQDKLHAEIDSVFGGSNRNLTYEDLQKLVYLEASIKESLRLFPSVPFIGRSCNGNVKLGEYQIKSGCSVILNVFWIHRDPRYFPDPEAFKPERFLSEAENDERPSFAFLPFSIGRRNCIGQKFAMMELKVQMAHLLRNFKLSTDQTLSDIGYCFHVIIRPEKPILITVTPRYS